MGVLPLSQSKLPQRLLKPQLPTLPLLLPLLPQLRERGVRLMPLSSVDIPESSLLPLPRSTTHQQSTTPPIWLILMLVLVMPVLDMLVLVMPVLDMLVSVMPVLDMLVLDMLVLVMPVLVMPVLDLLVLLDSTFKLFPSFQL